MVGIERELVGGECPYWGCVPSKMTIRAANLLMDGRRISGIAGDAKVRPDWGPVAERIRQEATDNWDDKRCGRPLREQERRARPRQWPVAGWLDAGQPDRVEAADRIGQVLAGIIQAAQPR